MATKLAENTVTETVASTGTVIKSVARALDILETLSAASGNMPLSKLSAATGLNNSTCHHLISTLAARGYVTQNSETRSYGLGNKVFDLSEARARQFDLLDIAMPAVRDLNRRTGEAVHLALIQARELVTVAKLDSRHAVKVDSGFAGKSNATHATASGKAILAWLPEAEQKAILDTKGMTVFTEHTITDVDKLKEELALVRRHGFASDVEEFQPGVICVGAAIRNHTGGVIASISASMPAMRASDEARATVIEEVKETAAMLSEKLGSRPPI